METAPHVRFHRLSCELEAFLLGGSTNRRERVVKRRKSQGPRNLEKRKQSMTKRPDPDPILPTATLRGQLMAKSSRSKRGARASRVVIVINASAQRPVAFDRALVSASQGAEARSSQTAKT